MSRLRSDRVGNGVVPLLMAFALACGASESHDGPGPSDGSLVVSPPTRAITVGSPGAAPPCVGADLRTFDYLITVFNAEGVPVGNADVDISVDFAGNTTTAGAVVTTLSDGGLIVSNPGDPVPYRTETDKFGNKRVQVTFDLSPDCTYTGSLNVRSGNLVADSQFTVAP
jgi:hypothetical protein